MCSKIVVPTNTISWLTNLQPIRSNVWKKSLWTHITYTPRGTNCPKLWTILESYLLISLNSAKWLRMTYGYQYQSCCYGYFQTIRCAVLHFLATVPIFSMLCWWYTISKKTVRIAPITTMDPYTVIVINPPSKVISKKCWYQELFWTVLRYPSQAPTINNSSK